MGDFQAAFVGTAFSLRLLNANTLVQQFLDFFGPVRPIGLNSLCLSAL